MKSLAVIGTGSRGTVYAGYACGIPSLHMRVVAAVDPRRDRLEMFARRFDVPAQHLYSNADEFFAQGKIADAVIIASMDRAHYGQAMKAIDLGYDLLLEKPISPDPLEAIRIRNKAQEMHRSVVICHVLRYTNFFTSVKEIVDSGELGKIVTIQHAENVGNFHMAHSFVRGNWRNSDQTTSMIMQKSCHDLDILVWLTGSRAAKMSSFGDLTYFKKENAPAGSADRCLTCPVAAGCRFDVRKVYLPVVGTWPADVVCDTTDPDELLKALETSPYGRCVFRCDNNVCDHQVTIIRFENGVTASFHLSGMSSRMHRHIKVMCENGSIEGDDADNILTVTRFVSNQEETYETRQIHVSAAEGFHGGGDLGLIRNFAGCLENGPESSRSLVADAVESHIMAYAAEKSRLSDKTVDVTELRRQLEKEAAEE